MGMSLTGGGVGAKKELFIYSAFYLFVSCFLALLCKMSIQSPTTQWRIELPRVFGLSTEHKR